MKKPSLLKHLANLIGRSFKRAPKKQATPQDVTNQEGQTMHNYNDGLVPYDENLLERARTQWQFGDWESLIKIERETLQHHPDRAKLALLAAAGHMQLGDSSSARKFTQLAKDWGCSKKLISQILIAGVHNSLGRAAAVNGQDQRALQHFENAIAAGAQANDRRLLTNARNNEQRLQLGLFQTSHKLTEDTVTNKIKQFSNIGSKEDRKPEWLDKLIDECFLVDDVLEKIDRTLAERKLTEVELLLFYIELAERFRKQNDKMTAMTFLNFAREHTANANASESLQALLAKKFIELGYINDATDIIVQFSLSKMSENNLSNEDKKVLERTYEKMRINQNKKSEHGHDLLLTYLQGHFAQLMGNIQDRKPVLIEIGTTRENVPGQGSTLKIAEFCQAKNLHFITVDIDPHNTFIASTLFKKLDLSFEAITMKGEDYLHDYNGSFDFIFLDAYDFDHGSHSKLRQSRYKKYLGASIDNAECHRMHLDCAKSVVKKLTQQGLVCVDDTWLEDGKWTAKGMLAMPYLLENGFHVLEARNRAALLIRSNEAAHSS